MNYPGIELHFHGYELPDLERIRQAKEHEREGRLSTHLSPRAPLTLRVRRLFQRHA